MSVEKTTKVVITKC